MSLALLPVRRAVCALVAGPSRATGWLVSANGVFATSHAALGYNVDVGIENELGDSRPGRVVWVDVARDLAFVFATEGLPRGVEPMAPLPLRDEPPAKIGERVFAVSVLPGRGVRLSSGTVCAAPGSAGQATHFDTDAGTVGPAGGPLIDTEQRAVGLVTSCPPVHIAKPERRRIFAIPAATVRLALHPLELASDLAEQSPVYRCPGCASPFVPEHDACLACGAPLPHPFPPHPGRAASERIVRDALAAVGVVANRARTGPRSWHLSLRATRSREPVVVTIELDEAGTTAAFRTPIAFAPAEAHEPFFRLLLTLNDQATGAFRLALAGSRVVLVWALPLAALREHDMVPMLASFGEMSEHYRKILHDGFDAPPLFALDEPPAW
jgi:hypothetical protein